MSKQLLIDKSIKLKQWEQRYEIFSYIKGKDISSNLGDLEEKKIIS